MVVQPIASSKYSDAGMGELVLISSAMMETSRMTMDAQLNVI